MMRPQAAPPDGRGRPEVCRTVATYWGAPAMGFGEMLLTPEECAVPVPDSVPLDVASLAEPMGVSLDLVQVAEVTAGDHVLVIGPGPLGLGAVALSRRAGAERVMLAGRSHSVARMEAGLAFLGLGDATAKSWGLMMRYALDLPGLLLTDRWLWWLLPPGLCITLLVLALVYVGMGLEGRLHPRLARR